MESVNAASDHIELTAEQIENNYLAQLHIEGLMKKYGKTKEEILSEIKSVAVTQ